MNNMNLPAIQPGQQQPVVQSTVNSTQPAISQNPLSFNIIILDDNYVIRNVLKNEIYRSIKKEFPNIKPEIFSSNDGVGGLGYIYLVKPSVIIIDTTLPRYSGREIFEFLQSNNNYNISDTLVILTTEKEDKFTDLPKNFVIINKGHMNFINEVSNGILAQVQQKYNFPAVNYYRSRLGTLVSYLANQGDILNNPRLFSNSLFLVVMKPIFIVLWVFLEFLIAPFFILYNLSVGNVLGENNISAGQVGVNYRSHNKPQAIIILTNLLYTIFKLVLFLLVNIIILLISREI